MNKAGSRKQELLLTAALARFRGVDMPARNLSPQTRRGYGYDLSEWVATTPPSLSVSALSTDGIARYLSTLDARGLRGATRHRKVAAIKTFLRYLEREGALPVDFSARLSWPEVARDEPRALSVGEYTALLREAGHHPRDAAILPRPDSPQATRPEARGPEAGALAEAAIAALRPGQTSPHRRARTAPVGTGRDAASRRMEPK